MLAGFTAIVTVGVLLPAVRSAQKPNCAEAAGASSRFQDRPVNRTAPPAALAIALQRFLIVPCTVMSVAHTTRAAVVFVTVAFTQYPAPQSLDVWTCAGRTVTVVAALTVSVAARPVVTPGPVQVSVYVPTPADAVVTLRRPPRGRVPPQAPVAVHAVAFVADQLSVAVWPRTIADGSTVNATVGGDGPDEPFQSLRSKVSLSSRTVFQSSRRMPPVSPLFG